MPKQSEVVTTINEAGVDLFDEMLAMDSILKGIMKETELGPTIFDLGIKADGGYLAGEYVTQVCLGGLAEVSLNLRKYSENLTLPALTVVTDFPAISTMGSQFAGWAIDKFGYKAMGSGPARIFAKKPKKLYEQLPILDSYDETVIVLETNQYPSEKIMRYIAEKCKVSLDGLCIILTPTTSIAGATQIAGRSVETAIHKLYDLGMDITKVTNACGNCPIAPLSNDNDKMMGRTNDMLIYGSEVFLNLDYSDEEELESYVNQAVSSQSESYGKLFYEIVKEVKGDFYKIDPSLFAPAKLVVNNKYSGKTFSSGNINVEMLIKSIQ